jgi:glycine/D-amino acid oxidase-like deaminating enzyme/nitrite reductase/ring-hydroxylating ferredoxin subunit
MGSLDERNTSYWIATSDRRTPEPLSGDISTEVVVIGGGITGLTTAYLLAREGVPVVLLEADQVCSGVTAYTTGKITSQHGLIYRELIDRHGDEDARAYAMAQEFAIDRIRKIIADENIDCDLQALPAMVYTEDPEKLDAIEAEVDAAGSLGLAASFESTTDLPFDVLGAVRFEDQSLFHPRRYCLGLARAVTAHGGIIAESSRALSIDDGPRSVVTTSRGSVRARAVVIASHAPFSARGAFFARLTPERSYAIAGRSDRLPGAMYISAEDPIRSIRPHPTANGEDVLIIGGGGHPAGRESNTKRYYADLEDWAGERFALEPTWRWSAFDLVPGDRIPFVGKMTPMSGHTYVATGYAKWGMTNATAAATIISDTIAGRETTYADLFSPARHAKMPQIATAMQQGAETVKSVVGDRIANAVSLRTVDDLQRGEGAVVGFGGRSVAAFRDEDDFVQAVSPTCTHLGCTVHFNDAERTWDCPCHGSRFDLRGRILSGPATRPLDRVDVSSVPEHDRS